MMAAALVRTCSWPRSFTRKGPLHRNGAKEIACLSQATTCSFASEARTRSDANAPKRHRRIELSREQMRRVWQALGDEPTRTLDRIAIDPERFPIELFGTTPEKPSKRISVDPSMFPLELFEVKDKRRPRRTGRIITPHLFEAAAAANASELLLELERRFGHEKKRGHDEKSIPLEILNAFTKACENTSESKRIYDAQSVSSEVGEPLEPSTSPTDQFHPSGSSAPKIHCGRAVMATWANAHTRGGVTRALDITRRMREAPHVHCSYDVASYERILQAYASIADLEVYDTEDPDAPTNRAVSLLVKMDPHVMRSNPDGDAESGPRGSLHEDLSRASSRGDLAIPNTKCYGAVLKALARAARGRKSTSFEQSPFVLAESILNRMESLYAAGTLGTAPNSHCYQNVIKALSLWANRSTDTHGVASSAERVMEKLENHLLSGDEISARATEVTRWYNQLISLVAKSSFGGSPDQADRMLERMENMYLSTDWSNKLVTIQPDEESYSSVIAAWADTSHIVNDSRAARAVNVLHRQVKMLKHQQERNATPKANATCHPSIGLYNLVIAACGSTTAEEADQLEALGLARSVFDELRSSSYTLLNSRSYARMIQAYSNLLDRNDTERSRGIREIFHMCCDDGKLDRLVRKVLDETCTQEQVGELLGLEATCHVDHGTARLNMLPARWRDEKDSSC